MRKMNLTKIFILSLLFAVVSISAQNKPQALKFDEFTVTDSRFYTDYDEITIAQRAERFEKQLKKERGAKAYIIYYKARISNENNWIQFLPGRIQGNVLSRTLQYDDIVTVDGGFRENAVFEFWIVPNNAEPPRPTPAFDKSEAIVCPNIYIVNETPYNQTEIAAFSIHSYDLKDIKNHTWKWQVSGGEIVEGRNPDSIKVKLNNSATKQVTAFLEVDGLPLPCRKIFTATAEIGNGKLYLIDVFGPIANGETRARIDALLSDLQKNPESKGYVIIYGNRASGARSIESRVRLYRNHFAFRNIDVSRITIMEGGYREETSSELWLAFAGEKPVPTPTVDAKFVEVPKPARKPRLRRK